MKRIITFALAFLFALSFSGCSGNLHEPLENETTFPIFDSGNSKYKNYFYFRSDSKGSYPVWMWDDDNNGGEVFTVAGTWPGDNMTYLCATSDGKFIYKYVITNTTLTPTHIIIGGDNKQFEGEYVNHGLYYNGATSVQEITNESALTGSSGEQESPQSPESGSEQNGTGNTDYDNISAAETRGNVPDSQFELDETAGSTIYTITNVPGWYSDGNAVIWLKIFTSNATYWKRVKMVSADSGFEIKFVTSKQITNAQVIRCNPSNLSEFWNGSVELSFENSDSAEYVSW